MRRLLRRGLTAFALLLVVAVGLAAWMLHNAAAMPLVRRLEVALPFPAGASRQPIRVALITDTHLSGPDNSPDRMARIVAQVNSLRPDLILIGGDYIGDDKGGATYSPQDSIAPFEALRAPLGVFAVLGNHDARRHTSLTARQWKILFARVGVRLLSDEAMRAGPLAIGGLKDIYTDRPDISGTLDATQALGGAPVLLAHGPDVFPFMPDKPLLTLVGHTHCGQIAFPFVGIVYVPSHLGTRYACGVYREGAKTMIVSGGIGTSGLPLRMLAPPDVWLVTIRPR